MKLPKDITTLKAWFKKHPRAGYALIGGSIVLVFWLMSSGDHTPAQRPQKIEKPVIEGVQAAVDPRALWSESLSQQINQMGETVKTTVAEQNLATDQTINSLKQEMDSLRYQLNQVQREKEAPKPEEVIEETQVVSETPKFVHLHQTFEHKTKKDTEDYVTSGSFARAVLLTGVVAETGTDSASSPQPILLRLVDFGIFSKGYATEQIKEAIIIGSCYGHLSSERTICRLESFSLVNKEGDIVERPVEGWLIGEDGRPGLRGDVIDKSSDVARSAILNGILGGMAGFLQNQATAGIYPVSPISGASHALTGLNAVKAGAASGVGNALQKLADYAIKRAEQMNPVIVVGAGRVIDVVFKKGFQLKDITPINNTPLKAVSSVSSQSNQTQPITGEKTTRQAGYNQAMGSLNNLQMNQGEF